ncbi:MAG: chemotaxis protein CheW [Pseudanabaenales cyanobacterium]|nr:chemotaxis protein CheW [Pseudanabaenales cyanobacterium]
MDNNTLKIAKFITFKVVDYWFALPMAAVLKIVNCPPQDKGGVVTLGIVQLGSHTIQLLDLHGVLGLDADATPPDQAPFLLVLRSTQKKLWGIALDTPPDLSELPLNTFQAVSIDNRFVLKKQWISHIATVSEQEINRTLLLLNLKAIFAHKAA